MIDAPKANATADPVDPDDDVDLLQPYSQFAESNDSDREERDENPESEAEQAGGHLRRVGDALVAVNALRDMGVEPPQWREL